MISIAHFVLEDFTTLLLNGTGSVAYHHQFSLEWDPGSYTG
jgi:hypothetical protein